MAKRKQYREFTIKHDIWEHPKFKELKPSAKLVYIELCREYNWWIIRCGKDPDELFHHSERQIAEGTGLSRRMIGEAKMELKKLGLIEISRGTRIVNNVRCGHGTDFFKLCHMNGHDPDVTSCSHINGYIG